MNRVLVTGLPRSGTTFVGQVLATPPDVAYVHEPLNMQCGLPSVPRNFIALDDERFSHVADEMSEMLELRGRLRGAVYPTDSRLVRTVKHAVPGRGPAQLWLARLPPTTRHVVVKDPFAIWSTSWFAEHDCHIVMMVRHPAATVASFRRLGWNGRNQIKRFAATDGFLDERELGWVTRIRDDLDSIVLFWTVVHRRVLSTLAESDIVIHERISADPDVEIEAIRSRTGLPSSRRADRKLAKLTSGRRAAADPQGRTQQFRRASADILASTLATLNDDELERVWDISGDIAGRWYRPDGIR